MPTNRYDHYIDQILAPGGLLERSMRGYEARPGQLRLAHEIDIAMCFGEHIIAEAECGTGKTAAYGVPAIAHACCNKMRCAIVTANIQLQEQLVKKDLPLLHRILPFKFEFALLKGRNNYACRDRFWQGQTDDSFAKIRMHLDGRQQLDAALEWMQTSSTGDKSELSPEPAFEVWSAISTDSDECKRNRCTYKDECFANAARNTALRSHIIVTNYHTLFSYMRRDDNPLMLPHMVLDEAHEVARIARDFMGFKFTQYSIGKVTRWLQELGKRGLPLRGSLEAANTAFFAASGRMLGQLKREAARRKKGSDCRLTVPNWTKDHLPLMAILSECKQLAADRFSSPDADPASRIDAEQAFNKISEILKQLHGGVELNDNNSVYWLEETGKRKNVALQAKLIDVSTILHERLFKATRSITLSSATLSVDKSFSFIQRELGVPENAKQCIVTSPFNLYEQSLFVVPPDSPLPQDERRFQQATADAIEHVATACGGRTLGLFTSNKNLRAVRDLLIARNLPYRLLAQDGELSRAELYQIFKSDESSILLGVASFWTGVDVPGEALVGLVIDKLPFPNLSDPFIDALEEKWKKAAFNRYSLPHTIITLKQGIGRLIRRKDDYGVVVLVDSRVLQKRYGVIVTRSLPPMRSTPHMTDIVPFIEKHRAARAARSA